MKPSNISDLLYQTLNYNSERQKVISSNIANINTPNYKTKDVSFETHMNKLSKDDLKMTTTNKNHIGQDYENSPSLSMQKYEVKNLQEQNDGNNVSLDDQISEMSKNAVMQDAITNSIKRDSRWFKLMIDAAGKN